MPANLYEGSLQVGVLRHDSVHHAFEFQVLEGDRWGGEFLLEELPELKGILDILVGMNEGSFDGHGESAKALVIGVMPVVDPGLVDNFVILLLFNGLIDDDGIPCTNGAEIASNEGCPLLVVGASEMGNTRDEVAGRGGYFENDWFWSKRC